MTELNNVVHSRATRIVDETDDIVKERVGDSMKIVLHELHGTEYKVYRHTHTHINAFK